MLKISPFYKFALSILYNFALVFGQMICYIIVTKDEVPLRYRKDPRNGNLMQLLGMCQRERRPKACLTIEDGEENPFEMPIAGPANDTAAKICRKRGSQDVRYQEY